MDRDEGEESGTPPAGESRPEHGGTDPASKKAEPESGKAEPVPEEVVEAMEPLEPYTTREVANIVDIPRRVARKLLDALYDAGDVEKKSPHEDGGRTIWVRSVPHFTCEECGHEFMVRIVHPVLASVRYCPRCGARVD